MYSKFRTENGKPNQRKTGFDFFKWIESFQLLGNLATRAVNRRIELRKLEAKPYMKQAAAEKRRRRALRNLKRLESCPNYSHGVRPHANRG